MGLVAWLGRQPAGVEWMMRQGRRSCARHVTRYLPLHPHAPGVPRASPRFPAPLNPSSPLHPFLTHPAILLPSSPTSPLPHPSLPKFTPLTSPPQLHSTVLTLLAAIVQLAALVWYGVSYFPMGGTGLRFAARVGGGRVMAWMND
jgi:hypothetical protein